MEPFDGNVREFVHNLLTGHRSGVLQPKPALPEFELLDAYFNGEQGLLRAVGGSWGYVPRVTFRLLLLFRQHAALA